MNKTVVIVTAALLLCAGVFTWYLMRETQDETPAPIVTPPAVEPQVARQANTRVTLAKRYFEPSSLTVQRGTTLFVTVIAVDEGVSIFVPTSGEKYDIPRDTSRVVAITGTQDATIICAPGCIGDVILPITVVD